ncbi:toprim domain-containing protein [Candidatus Poribacteria bacterium]|nr:toprim domain-containing protein [Candidatus Poribacteria bacterium]
MNSNQAKKIEMSRILDQLGYQPHHEIRGELWYFSPLRQETQPSFKVTQGNQTGQSIWYDHGEGRGGNLLDFITAYYDLPKNDIKGALRKLGEITGHSQKRDPSTPNRFPQQPPPKTQVSGSGIEIHKVQPLQNRALIGYLRKRGISRSTATPYLKEIYYTRRKKNYFALAFPNDSGGYELRNPYFKGVDGTKEISVLKQIDWLVKRKTGVKPFAVTVFEGFMDFLSALTYYQKEITTPVIVLNSVAMRNRAVETITEMQAKKVYLYLDRDKSGRDLTCYFKKALLGIAVLDKSDLYAGEKDFNAFLITRLNEHPSSFSFHQLQF